MQSANIALIFPREGYERYKYSAIFFYVSPISY